MIPGKYEAVENQMQNILCETTYRKNIESPAIAYTYTRTNTLCGTIYRIFVNNTDEEFARFLYMHECGHILFGHCKNLEMKMSMYVEMKLKAGFKKIAGLFGYDVKKWYPKFQAALLNIVMDFEVNSSLFSNDEWNFMNMRLNKFFSSEKKKGMWPEDYGLPSGKTWNEYLNMILMDSEKLKSFFEQIRKQRLKSGFSAGKSEYSEAEYNELKEKIVERSCEEGPLDSSELEEMVRLAEEHGGAIFSPPTGSMSGMSNLSFEPVAINYTTYRSMPDLFKKIVRLLKVRNEKKFRRHQLYNYNRRKINSNVIIPKDVMELEMTNRRLYILIDVSGSVDPKMIYDFCMTFSRMENSFKDVRFISWHTKLVQDWGLGEAVCNKYGGSTDMAKGMKYLRETYRLKNKDVFFMISDFCDNLHEWQSELSHINAEKYAINWNPEGQDFNPGFTKILKRGN